MAHGRPTIPLTKHPVAPAALATARARTAANGHESAGHSRVHSPLLYARTFQLLVRSLAASQPLQPGLTGALRTTGLFHGPASQVLGWRAAALSPIASCSLSVIPPPTPPSDSHPAPSSIPSATLFSLFPLSVPSNRPTPPSPHPPLPPPPTKTTCPTYNHALPLPTVAEALHEVVAAEASGVEQAVQLVELVETAPMESTALKPRAKSAN